MSNKKNSLRSIDAPIYSLWSALYLSFYSRRLYVDVGKRWHGLGILYLLLTIAVFSLPFSLRMSLSLNDSFNKQITEPLSKIPIFYIQNGEASFDKPMPYFIKNTKGKVIVIMDTTGKINDFTNEYPDASILINKHKISLKIPRLQLYNFTQTTPDDGAPLVQEFDKETNLVFDGKKLAEDKSITHLKYFSEMLIYPIVVALFFSLFIVFFFVLGFLGEVFSTVFFSFKIKFTQSVRLLIVAGTPMMLFLIIMLTLNYLFAGSGIILVALLLIYYSFALYSLRAESKQAVHS
ncbi:MAG: DUF1189 family protein [Legionella longbeachae]|nr:DUF1189 family protein [Legionella longbeachae]